MVRVMRESELSKRIEELDTGKHDPESLRQLALKLHSEGYPPTMITQALKRKFGRGVPLTIFSKEPVSGKSVKSKISAEKTVQAKISRQITAEANETITEVLKTGRLVEEKVGPIARQYGYNETGKFVVEMAYPFFDLYFDHVEKLEVEKLELQSGMQKMIEHFGPEAKRRLFNLEVWNLVQANFMAGAVGLHPIPPGTLQGYMKVLWDAIYQDDGMNPGFWTKKYIEKITETQD